MNTPTTKQVVRVARKRTLSKLKPPKGNWEAGIQNPEHARLVGQIISYLPHLEEMMIAVLARLLGHPASDNGPARQVFHSMKSEHARILVLKALLKDAFINLEKPRIFDEAIDLFETVKDKRNDFAHALWFTHESGRVFLGKPSSDMKELVEWGRREVPIGEIKCDLKRMQELADKINEAINWVDPRPIAVGMRRMRLRWGKKPKPAPDPDRA